tara:strand:+ start:2120 stop:2290 length:171 start_codon:yes stop_codon:yes gene_type:complete
MNTQFTIDEDMVSISEDDEKQLQMFSDFLDNISDRIYDFIQSEWDDYSSRCGGDYE